MIYSELNHSISVVCGSFVGAIGSVYVILNSKLPKNSFSILIRLIMIANLSLTSISLLDLVNNVSTWNSIFIRLWCTNLTHLIFRLYCFLSVSLSIIPLYIINFHGSISSIHWIPILGYCVGASAVSLFLSNPIGPIDRWYGFTTTLDSLLLLFSAIIMLACFFITYRTLKSQQSNRRTLLSGDTFYTHENFKHHASVMMMRYIGVLFVIDFLIWMPSICYSICLIVYNFPPQSNLPLIMELSYNIFEVTFAANGLFHAIGIHLAQRKIILVPPKPDSENPPQIIQISPTSEIQPIFQRSHYSNSIRGTIDLIREGEGQVLTTASLAIPSYQSSFLESTEGVEDPGIVTAYVHNYVVHPVIFIKAMLVAYWTSMFTWMSNRP